MFKTVLAIIGGIVVVYHAAKAWDAHCSQKYKAEAFDSIQAAARTAKPSAD
jgi:hypothetical protein